MNGVAVSSVAVSEDGWRAVSASEDTTLKVWDLETGREMRTLAGHSGPVSSVAVSLDWRCAVSASRDKTLRVWDLETGRQLRALAGHSEYVHGVAVSSDGRRAVSASWDNTVKVWDLETGTVVANFTNDAATLCCAFVENHTIIVGDRAGRVQVLSFVHPRQP
jgi:WD40 repeat protein